MLRVLSVAVAAATATPALAIDGPALPSTARKLTRDDIIAAMHGQTFKYKSYNHDELKTGTTRFDFKRMTYSGTYTDKGKTKSFKNEPLSMNSQAYCYDKTCPEGAGAVYADGATFYEVTDKGKVGEVLTR